MGTKSGSVALVSLHHGHHNKTPNDQFGLVESAHPWLPQEISADDLIDHISHGKAWVACLLRHGKRDIDSAGEWNLIVLDIDGDLSYEEFWKISFVQRHCLFSYTTPSHQKPGDDGQPPQDRFRAVFSCGEQRLSGEQLHIELYGLVLERCGLELKDDCGEKPERLWYGNSETDYRFGEGVHLSWELIEDAKTAAAQAEVKLQENRQVVNLQSDGKDEQRAIAVLDLNLIAPSQEGEYDYWQKVLNAAAAFGSDAMYQAFMAWTYRGFHGTGRRGKPPQRVSARRWQKAGGKSALGTLFKMAKEQQGEGWWRLLPDDLHYPKTAPRRPVTILSVLSPTTGAPLGDGFYTPDQPAVVEPEGDALEREAAAPEVDNPVDNPAAEVDEPGTEDENPFKDAKPSDVYKVPHRPGTVISFLVQKMEEGFPKDDTSRDGETEGIEVLLARLYVLRTTGKGWHHAGSLKLFTPQEQIAEDRKMLGRLLSCRGFLNSAAEVERDLLLRFRQDHGLKMPKIRKAGQVMIDGTGEDVVDWLVPNWVISEGSHIIYSKAGVGKTIFSIHLLRALTGDPAMTTFLDSGPLNNRHLWKRSRTLYIASDMAEAAVAMTNTYIQKLGLAGREFFQQVDWWVQDPKTGGSKWQATLPHLAELITALQRQAETGEPYTAVVIDSMKSICPPGLRVGDQAFSEYLQLITEICNREGAALIWIHHSAKDGNGMQGVQAISENASAIYRLSRENDSSSIIQLAVEKQRGGGRSRELHVDLFCAGAPRLVCGGDGAGDGDPFLEPVMTKTDHRKRDILRFLEEHLLQFRIDHPGMDSALLVGSYLGASRQEIEEACPASKRSMVRSLQELLSDGVIEKLGVNRASTYRIALDNDGMQTTLDPFTAS